MESPFAVTYEAGSTLHPEGSPLSEEAILVGLSTLSRSGLESTYTSFTDVISRSVSPIGSPFVLIEIFIGSDSELPEVADGVENCDVTSAVAISAEFWTTLYVPTLACPFFKINCTESTWTCFDPESGINCTGIFMLSLPATDEPIRFGSMKVVLSGPIHFTSMTVSGNANVFFKTTVSVAKPQAKTGCARMLCAVTPVERMTALE